MIKHVNTFRLLPTPKETFLKLAKTKSDLMAYFEPRSDSSSVGLRIILTQQKPTRVCTKGCFICHKKSVRGVTFSAGKDCLAVVYGLTSIAIYIQLSEIYKSSAIELGNGKICYLEQYEAEASATLKKY